MPPQIAGGQQTNIRQGNGGAFLQICVCFRIRRSSVGLAVLRQFPHDFSPAGSACALVDPPHGCQMICAGFYGGRRGRRLAVMYIMCGIRQKKSLYDINEILLAKDLTPLN